MVLSVVSSLCQYKLNKAITFNVVEATIKSLTSNKILELDRFTDEFYNTFKEDIIPILFNLLHKIEYEEPHYLLKIPY